MNGRTWQSPRVNPTLKFNQTSTKTIIDYILQSKTGDERPYLKVDCYGVTLLRLLDLGATYTILGNAGIAKLRHLQITPVNNSGIDNKCIVADGFSVTISSVVSIPLKLMNRVILLEVAQVPSFSGKLILGVDF